MGDVRALLPVERKITEREALSFVPFGYKEDGERVEDVSGRLVSSVVQHLHTTASSCGREPSAGEDALELLCQRLNDAAGPCHQVTPEFLLDEWNSYSYEYYHYAMELAKEIAGTDALLFTRGARSIPPALAAVFRALSAKHIYELVPRLAKNYVRHTQLEILESKSTTASFRMTFGEHYRSMCGEYLLACTKNACDSYKGVLASIPARLHGSAWATVEDVQCMARGDACCEWRFHWTNPRKLSFLGTAFGTAAAWGVVASNLMTDTWEMLPWGAALAALLGGVVIDTLRTRRLILEEKTELLREQGHEFERQFAELEQVHRKLHSVNEDLERQVDERTRELLEANARLEALTVTDALTGIGNRRYFFERLGSEVRRSRRYRKDVSILMVDVDHFKAINDEFGHQVGDSALSHLAETLQKGIRESDTVCRYGGEEFIVLLPETAHDGACIVADKLRRVVQETSVEGPRAQRVSLSISVGVACLEQDESPDDLIGRADRALYVAKARGRNRVVSARNMPQLVS